MGGGVDWWPPLLSLRVISDVASLEFSVRDVVENSVCVVLFALGLALRTSCLFRLSPKISIMDVDRATEVGVRRASVLCAGVVRGR